LSSWRKTPALRIFPGPTRRRARSRISGTRRPFDLNPCVSTLSHTSRFACLVCSVSLPSSATVPILFSCVPTRVQNKMFEICQHHLAPTRRVHQLHTYPAWSHPGIGARHDFIPRHSIFLTPRPDWQAKALFGFVAEATQGGRPPYQRVLPGGAQAHGQLKRYYLHHEPWKKNNKKAPVLHDRQELAVNGLQ